MVKSVPAMQETGVRFLGREDLPEKGMATLCRQPIGPRDCGVPGYLGFAFKYALRP